MKNYSRWEETCEASDCHPSTLLSKSLPDSGHHTIHLNASVKCTACHYGYLNNSFHKNGIYDADTDAKIVYFNPYNPSTGWDNATSNCSNIDCHSGGDSLYKSLSRLWGSVSVKNGPEVNWYAQSAGCTTCHTGGSKIDPITTGGSGTQGKHYAHVTTGNVSCERCHENYKNSAAHMNGTYGSDETETIVAFGGTSNGLPVSVQFDASTGACDNISCHGGSGGVNWYGESSGCTACHIPGGPYDPLPNGSHTQHVTDRGYNCSQCHENYTGESTHANGTLDNASTVPAMLSFNATLNSGGGFTTSPLTCTGLTCHGNSLDAAAQGTNTSPQWGTPATGECGTCHKTDSSISQGSHPAHVSVPYSFACDRCHDDGSVTTEHHRQSGFSVDGDVNVSFDSLNPAGTIIALTCQNLYCHGASLPVIDGDDTTPEWGVSSTGQCGDCHATTGKISGSHPAHFDTTRGPGLTTLPDDCTINGCHGSSHVDGSVDFNDSQSFADTAACDTCHSPGGSYNGVDSTGGSIGAKDNWSTGVYTGNNLQTGKEKWCAGCHDDSPPVINTVSAPNVIGDESGNSRYGATGYGFYTTGHGLPATGKYVWTGPSGRDGAGLNCGTCHDFSLLHIDAKARSFDCTDGCDPDEYRNGYRLNLVGGNNPVILPRNKGCVENVVAEDFNLCLQSGCHASDPFINSSSTATNFRNGTFNTHYYHLAIRETCGPGPTFYADWRDLSQSSRTTCIHCHNVHGTTQLSMVREEIPVAYNSPGVSDACGSGPSPQDEILPNSTGTWWNANTTSGGFCLTACHGSCGWNALYSRTPLP